MSEADKSQQDRLRAELTEKLALPAEAIGWLCDLFAAIQFMDDVRDRVSLSSKTIEEATYRLLADLPGNPFYLKHAWELHPLLQIEVLKWCGANAREDAHEADARSYSWRAGFYEVVLQVVRIVHGPKAAAESANAVLGFYGETFEDYMKEFEPHA